MPEMPPVQTKFIETNDPLGPFGAKGLGRPTTIPTRLPSLSYFNAIGVRIKDLPITRIKSPSLKRKKENRKAGKENLVLKEGYNPCYYWIIIGLTA